jgi:hypothetical protein
MPVPRATEDGANAGPTLLALFRQLHQDLRGELAGLDDEALNWVPVPGANSIGTIVTHLVGSEAEAVFSVAGVGYERDRDAEFAAPRMAMTDVLRLVDEADELIGRLAPRITEARLAAEVSLPTLPPETMRSGLTWLVGNYGHAREHLGQIELTKQLLR